MDQEEESDGGGVGGGGGTDGEAAMERALDL